MCGVTQYGIVLHVLVATLAVSYYLQLKHIGELHTHTTQRHRHTHTYTHAHTHARMHAHAHAHTHTLTHTWFHAYGKCPCYVRMLSVQ